MENSPATTACSFCSISETNDFLAGSSTSPGDLWMNFGTMWILFSIFFSAGFLYWMFRVMLTSMSIPRYLLARNTLECGDIGVIPKELERHETALIVESKMGTYSFMVGQSST